MDTSLKTLLASGLVLLMTGIPASSLHAADTGAAPGGTDKATAKPATSPAAAKPASKTGAAGNTAGASPLCSDATSPEHGPHLLYCVDTTVVSEKSYCLRSTGHKPEHVRGLKNSDALVTIGKDPHATVIRYESASKADPCYDPAFKAFMAKGDRIVVKKSGAGLALQIRDLSAKPPKDRFTPALDLRPDPKGGNFYWTGSRDGIDYFVMLADDKLGNMGRNDKHGVKRIEHFYRIEAFKQSYASDSTCYQARPDFPGFPETGLNFAEWTQGQASCDLPASPQQNGSGGGGSGWPP
jgi:hypothetical protein